MSQEDLGLLWLMVSWSTSSVTRVPNVFCVFLIEYHQKGLAQHKDLIYQNGEFCYRIKTMAR